MNYSRDFQAYRQIFLKAFPEAEGIELSLTTKENTRPFFYFARSEHPDLDGCWYVIARLGAELEAKYSISSEVLLLFSRFRELQRRSFNALVERGRKEVDSRQRDRDRQGAARFTPDPSVAFLWSPDPGALDKLRVWNTEGSAMVVAPLPTDVGLRQNQVRGAIERMLGEVMAERDLYRGRKPVTGADFFGREDMLLSLTTELRTGRSIGLFGLRRSGKTSLMREIQRRERPRRMVFALTDLEGTSSVEETVRQIAADLSDELRGMRSESTDIWIGNEEEQVVSTASELATRIKRLAAKNDSFRFVIALDEIETLNQLIATSSREVAGLLGALRNACQSSDNVALLCTGVTTKFFQEGMLTPDYGNPLFGFVDSTYLPPFTLDETKQLVRNLGDRMQLAWSNDATELMHKCTGGFPFFVRDLASEVRRVARQERRPGGQDGHTVVIDVEHVELAREPWSVDAHELWSEIVTTLETQHELMAIMLREPQTISSWLSLGSEARRAIDNLIKLGLLEGDVAAPAPSQTLRALNALAERPTTTRARIQEEQGERDEIRALAKMPEGFRLEFKETARWDIRAEERNPAIEAEIVKTVAAFLNADGGELLVGVSDSGEIVGIGPDLKISGGSLDVFENWLCSNLLSQRLGADVVANHVRIRIVDVHGPLVVRVGVNASPKEVYVEEDSKEYLYVRVGNATRRLGLSEAVDYVINRRRTERD